MKSRRLGLDLENGGTMSFRCYGDVTPEFLLAMKAMGEAAVEYVRNGGLSGADALFETPETEKLMKPEQNKITNSMDSAPRDGTHILAHDGSLYFPPTVIHWHVDGWYLSKWPTDENNLYHPACWYPLPWPWTPKT